MWRQSKVLGGCILTSNIYIYPRLCSLSLNLGQKVEEVGEWDNSVWR